MNKIFFALTHKNARCPERVYENDAGFDLFAAEETIIPPLGRAIIDTGVVVLLNKSRIFNNEKNCLYVADVRPRSGNAIKSGLTVLNTPGTIDELYTGNIKVILFNSDKYHPVNIFMESKIAQLVIHKIPLLQTEVIYHSQEWIDNHKNDNITKTENYLSSEEFHFATSIASQRNKNGFGSSGTV